MVNMNEALVGTLVDELTYGWQFNQRGGTPLACGDRFKLESGFIAASIPRMVDKTLRNELGRLSECPCDHEFTTDELAEIRRRVQLVVTSN